ncbi:hypothetical protein J5N97_004831 [Dioscorea zingiberensis]|uniref:G-patch domain-containing protein n=1 Tax=Dioscorea zingiberensis TaxID=325984 RepID=A0A9D5HRB6_9LILI|nr:hypothetical protein J5N97_004831 [Dioscorea zingiberensis]
MRELLRLCDYFKKNFSKVTVPYLTVHGTDDGVTSPEGSKMLYEMAKTFRPLLLWPCRRLLVLDLGWRSGVSVRPRLQCRGFEMDSKQDVGKYQIRFEDSVQIEKEQALSDSFTEDFADDFRLPISHRPTENLDMDNLEQVSLDTQITSSNVGFRLLQKMGWKGKGLGKDEQGIVEPIRTGIRDPKLGVGKQEQDDFFTAGENVQRKKLEVELEETEEHTKKREVIAEREQKIQTEVKEIQKVFFCNLCNKQYKLAMEFEVHLSSYDHNHRKRFKEMKEMHGGSSRDDRLKREQLREEKEMAKFAQLADAHKQRQQQQEQPGGSQETNSVSTTTGLVIQNQRQALKFGFSSRLGSSKNSTSSAAKKPKVAVKASSIFGNDSDEES